MLDEYFQEQMTEIIKQCARTRQTLLFSATMTDAVNDLAAVSLSKPVKLFVDNNQDVAFNLRQEFVKLVIFFNYSCNSDFYWMTGPRHESQSSLFVIRFDL